MLTNSYEIDDIGLLMKFSTSTITAINDNNRLVGYFSHDAFLDADEHMDHCFYKTSLGVTELVGISVSGINDLGQVIGSHLEDGKIIGCLYDDNKITRLPVLPHTVLSTPKSINNNERVVGVIQTTNPVRRVACVWTKKKLDTLALSYGFSSSEALAINDQRQIVGLQKQTKEAGLFSEAVLWSSNRIVRLGTMPGCSESVATDINNLGQILIYGFNAVRGQGISNRQAYVWTQGNIRKLGVLKEGRDAHAVANSLNDKGQVVGNSLIEKNRLHACIWQQGSVFDLNDLIAKNTGWELISAQSINNSGRIACNGIYKGRVHAVVLIPKQG